MAFIISSPCGNLYRALAQQQTCRLHTGIQMAREAQWCWGGACQDVLRHLCAILRRVSSCAVLPPPAVPLAMPGTQPAGPVMLPVGPAQPVQVPVPVPVQVPYPAGPQVVPAGPVPIPVPVPVAISQPVMYPTGATKTTFSASDESQVINLWLIPRWLLTQSSPCPVMVV